MPTIDKIELEFYDRIDVYCSNGVIYHFFNYLEIEKARGFKDANVSYVANQIIEQGIDTWLAQ